MQLPEGKRVRVELVDAESPPSLMDRLGCFAGQAKQLPSDASLQHDHYLYRTPKKLTDAE
jgi:hypothetical protein